MHENHRWQLGVTHGFARRVNVQRELRRAVNFIDDVLFDLNVARAGHANDNRAIHLVCHRFHVRRRVLCAGRGRADQNRGNTKEVQLHDDKSGVLQLFVYFSEGVHGEFQVFA